MGKSRARRGAPKTETKRAALRAACAAHLDDLERVHGHPPPDIEIATNVFPIRLAPPQPSSFCTSPASLCEEFAK